MPGHRTHVAGSNADHDTTLMEASQLIGSPVGNHKSEHLGEIKEVILDARSGRVNYAVLSFASGFLGVRKKFFAVPWDALAFDPKSGSIVLEVEKDRLEHTPGFDKRSWPNTVDDLAWWRGMQFHY